MQKTLVYILMLMVFISNSQEIKTSNDYQPKVGLVLSGGGAKGFAHIGALKVIDSLGLKIDYVAGTSMGAIVGGLYASGYSGKELDSIFKSANFDAIVNDKLPREAKTFYERDHDERYAISLPFDNFELTLPSAISRGQNVFNLLTKVTLHVSDIDDFSKLPIPFFCIGTDVETGEPIILNKGNLARAMAASGAFPSLFQPVSIDDKVLIDGGVVNNFPVEELKKKDVDVILGVDVQDSLLTRKELKSAPDILLQVNNYRSIRAMKEKAKLTDILIKPNIKGFSVISFSEIDEIVKRGKLAAMHQSNIIKQLARRQKNTKTPKEKIRSVDSIKFDNISIRGNEKYTYSYIIGKLKLQEREKVNYYDFTKGVNNLVATNNFDSFDYKITKNSSGGYDLLAKVEETQNKAFLKFAAHYDDLYKTAFLANFTRKQLLFKNDVASLDIILGENIRYNFEYYIDKGYHWSVGINSRFNHFDKNINSRSIFPEGTEDLTSLNKLEIEYDDFTNQVFVQTLFQKDLALSLGVEHKNLRIDTETIVEEGNNKGAVFEDNNYYSAFGQLKLDSFTDKYYPKRGFLVDCNFHLYFANSRENEVQPQFSVAKGNFAFAFSIANKLSAMIGSQGGFRLGENETRAFDFSLGGYGNNLINNLTPFYGYDFLELAGNSFVKGYINLDYELFKKHHLKANVNYANVGNDIYQNQEWLSLPDYSGYALGYGLETFLGPVEATWSYSPETKRSIWFFNVGFWF